MQAFSVASPLGISILELADEYGKDRPFSEDRFREIVTEMPHPQVADFMPSYIVEAQPIPFEDYFAKIGIRYREGEPPTFELLGDATPEQVAPRKAC